MEITSFADVARYLRLRECNQSRREGDCSHPACKQARQAGELVALASDLLDPAAPAADQAA